MYNRYLKGAIVALVFVFAATGASAAEYCADHADSTCSNRVIARDTTRAYQQNPHGNLRNVLLYDSNQGGLFTAGKQALRRALSRLSRQYGFRLEITDAAGAIDSARLRGVDVLVFAFGADDVLGGDSSVAGVATQRYVYERGGSVLLVNAAAAFLRCPVAGADSLGHTGCVFLARAAARQFQYAQNDQTPMRLYADSVGLGETPPHHVCADLACSSSVPHTTVPPAAAAHHGVRNPETRNIFTGLPRTIDGLGDRWFSFRSSARRVGDMERVVPVLENRTYTEGRVNVLFSLDETSRYLDNTTRMGDHPVIWTRKMGKGLSAFSNLGHSDVYVRSRTVNAAQVNDSVAQKITWRLLRYLARDFTGCMNSTSVHYNPEASVERLTSIDAENPCLTGSSLRTASASPEGFNVRARSGALQISMPSGYESLRVLDVAGRLVAARRASGRVEIQGLEPGIYFVEARGLDGRRIHARVRLL